MKVERAQQTSRAWAARSSFRAEPRKVNPGHDAHNQDPAQGEDRQEQEGRPHQKSKDEELDEKAPRLLNLTV
jgi:hypothetical protein